MLPIVHLFTWVTDHGLLLPKTRMLGMPRRRDPQGRVGLRYEGAWPPDPRLSASLCTLLPSREGNGMSLRCE